MAYCSMETSPLSSLEETVVADGDEASQQQENFQNKGRKISIDSTNPGPGNILLCGKNFLFFGLFHIR